MVCVLEIKDKFSFDYAHFLGEYNGKCRNLHGHTAKVNVFVKGVQDNSGFVIDFKDLKEIIKCAVDRFDHKLIVSRKYVVNEEGGMVHIRYDKNELILRRDMVLLINGEVTIENIASLFIDYLAFLIRKKGLRNIIDIEVEISEGNNSYVKVNRCLGRWNNGY